MNSTPAKSAGRKDTSTGGATAGTGVSKHASVTDEGVYPTDQQSGQWSRARWMTVIGLLFAVQIGLLAMFGTHGKNHPQKIQSIPTAFHLISQPIGEETLAQNFFASDPTLFAMASWHGFSGEAWLRRPPPAYQFTESDEPPYWLSNNVEQLGKFPQISSELKLDGAFALSEKETPLIEALPYFIAPEAIRTQSIVRIEGELAGQTRKSLANFHPQMHTDLVTNSVVQVAANEAGEVISARLITRSGYAAADRDAVAFTRGLRFKPAPRGSGSRWGKIIFDWQTISPPETNGAKSF